MFKKQIEVYDGWPEWFLVDENGNITVGPFDEETEADIAMGWHWHGDLMATFPGMA